LTFVNEQFNAPRAATRLYTTETRCCVTILAIDQLLPQPLGGKQRETWRMIAMWIAAELSYSSASISVKGSSAEERTGTKDGSARSASALRSARIRTEVAPPDRNLGLYRAGGPSSTPSAYS
jgi:hypothetical protein